MADRLIQLGAVVVLAGGVTIAGALQPKMLAIADRDQLRYTDVSVEGAPPIVAIGTAIGALRGLIVDYLWLKVTIQKEKGLLYEVMADSDLISKLQPRFPEVWGFLGHNLAYNISVLTNTPEERWAWVNNGISLVRERGIRYNPNDLELHKELAFWFSHKIDGLADDAHLFYKRQFAREWHLLLGVPPLDYEKRKEWIKAVADAPDTLEALYEAEPETRPLVDELKQKLEPLGARFEFGVTKRFLLLLGVWAARESSPYARALGMKAMDDDAALLVSVFESTFGDPAKRKPAIAFLNFMRKRVLLDSYNMDPQLMYEFTRDTGPLDWRHPAAHALYWARRGSQLGEHRITSDLDISKVVNNDRTEIQAMQALARSGTVGFDPFSEDNVTRLPDARWIKTIDRYFAELYTKHYDTRGSGGETFMNFHQNFMKQAIRELYRSGDIEGAQEILTRLDKIYGRGSAIPHSAYDKPLDLFVQEVTFGEYEMQPEVARSDVYSVLERGFREGLLLDNEKLLKEALDFARDLTRYFRDIRYNDFVNKFGEGRMKDLLGELDESIPAVLTKCLLDTSQPLLDRMVIYRKAPEDLRALVYDRVREPLEMEYKASRLAATGRTFDDMIPAPPGLESARRSLAETAKQRAREAEERAQAEAQRK
jgi:hypothetical protein